MATLPARVASGTIIVIPSNGVNIIQTAPGLPTFALQASGAIPYPQYEAQQLGISNNAPQQVPQKGPLERFFNAEPKAIQIMIGLLHIGFGAASHQLFSVYYFTLSAIGGYPFWGGILFISTGSLCVAVVNYPSPGLDTIQKISYGFSSLLLLFSILEFCIAFSLAHFGCQATCCSGGQPTNLSVPYQVIRDEAVTTERNPPPSTIYNNMVTTPQQNQKEM